MAQDLTILHRPFESDTGFGWRKSLPLLRLLADDGAGPCRSPLRLYENGQPLTRPHCQTWWIRTAGCGLYSHRENHLRFSASDNSNPNENGREYAYGLSAEPDDPKRFQAQNRLMPELCQHIAMSAQSGFTLTRQKRILDFGCGDGAFVYTWRDLGFDAYGFDIHDTLCQRSGEDRKYFRFFEGSRADSWDCRLEDLHIPFEDDFFDFAFSLCTLEHVKNLDLAMAELARVLKPGALSFHVYVPRYVLVDPHTRVPLGGVFQGRAYLLACALAGIRNEFQKGLSARETMRHNARYLEAGLNYVAPSVMLSVCRRYFSKAAFVPQLRDFGGRSFVYKTLPYKLWAHHTRLSVLRLWK